MRNINNATKKEPTLARLKVWDGSSWISFGSNADYGRLYSVSLSNSVDQSSWTLECRFTNHEDLESLDPYYSGTFQNLLDQYHKAELEISKDDGDNWYTVFEGYASETDPERRVDKNDTVIFRPFDPSKRLKDVPIPYSPEKYWDHVVEWHNIDAFDLVDNILSAAGFDESLNRYDSDDPLKTVKSYKPRGQSVWKSIKEIFTQTGYELKYRFADTESNLTSDASSGQKQVEVSDGSKFHAGQVVKILEDGGTVSERNSIDSISSNTLTMTNNLDNTYNTSQSAKVKVTMSLMIFDPARGNVSNQRWEKGDSGWGPDYTFNGNWSRRDLRHDDKDVRNIVRVVYNDRLKGKDYTVTAEDTNNKYLVDSSLDPASSNKIDREMWLDQIESELIRKETDAQVLANYALDDVKAPQPEASFDLEFFYPNAQLYDIYRFGGSGDYTVDIGVTNIDHQIDVERNIGTTVLGGAVDRVIGERYYWLNQGLDDDEDIRQRGDGRPPDPPEHPPRLTKSVYQVESSGETKAEIVCTGESAPESDIIYYKWQYRVYRNGQWDQWKNIGTSDPDTPHIALGELTTGQNRKLQVKYAPIDRQSQESGGTASWSPVQEIPLNGDATPPRPPTINAPSPGPEQITFTWNNPTVDSDGSTLTDFETAVIYLKAESDPTKTDYDTRQEIDGEKWTYESTNVNTVYHVAVSAEDNSGNESSLSSVVTSSPNVKVGDGSAPSTPTGLSVNSNTIDHQEDGTVYSIIKLDWDDNSEEDLKGYEVGLSENDSDWDVLGMPESSEYTIKPLKPNTTYYFRVRATDTEQNRSSWTSSISVTTAKDTTPPSTPTGLSSSNKIGSVEFSWNEVTADDLRHYIVYVDPDNDSVFENTYTTKSTSFTIYGSSAQTIGCKVSAVDRSDNESSASSVVTGSPSLVQVGDSVLGIGKWTFAGSFSSTDYNTVSWTAGDLALPDGTTYSITSGNTGAMTALTYIYLDTGISTTAFQTSTTIGDALGNNKILVAAAENVSDTSKQATFQVYSGSNSLGFQPYIVSDYIESDTITAGEISGNTITASEISAGTITSNEIKSDTITANEIAANTITASQIDAGTITASEISSGTITATEIASGTITANEIDANTITASEIASGTITASEISADTITASEIDVDNLFAQSIQVTGNIYCASNNVQLGQNVGPNSIDGISIQSGGKLEVTDGAGDVVFDSSGTFVGYTKNGAPDTQVYNSTPSANTWVDLDLSSEIGSRNALVLLRIYNNGGSDTDFDIRSYGDTTINAATGSTQVARGTQTIRSDAGEGNYLLTYTNSSGKLEFQCEIAQNYQIDLMMYLLLSD